MIIKDFSLAKVASSIMLVLSATVSFGFENEYEEGKHYVKLSTPIQTEDPKKLKLLNTSPMGVLTVSDSRGSSLSGNLNLSQISFLREARPSGMSRVTRSLPGLTIP